MCRSRDRCRGRRTERARACSGNDGCGRGIRWDVAQEVTLRQHALVVPLKSIRVDVVEGVDAGSSRVVEQEAFAVGCAEGNDLVLHDPAVSRFHVELRPSEQGGALVVDLRSTNGTYVGPVRIERAYVPGGTLLKLGSTTLRIADAEMVALELFHGEALGGLRGRSSVMRRLMAQLVKLAGATASVLIIGESGTGKELMARAIHDASPRAKAPFVTVDCGALSPSLVASELFGHERGAFTGAERAHVGAFEQAHGGTIFLDEIGELPVHLQPALLGVLERRRFRRLGGRVEVPVDMRVVAATHRDLRSEVNTGTFRTDLFYRLAVAVLNVPPLRERLEDLPMLLEHFARECGYSGPIGALFPSGALDALASHHWPGNVRELRNVVEAAVATGETPQLERIASEIGADGAVPDPFTAVMELSYKEARAILLTAFERRYLERALQKAEGNVSRAARTARVDRSHFIDLLRRHELRADEF